MTPLVEILAVSQRDPDELLAFFLERPRAVPGAEVTSATYAVELEGWAVGKRQAVIGVEVVHGDVTIWRVPTEIERPDVAAAHPGAPKAALSGFYVPVSALNFPQEFEFRVRAVLEDQTSVEMARVQGRRALLRSGFEPRLAPLMITTPGRTGSRALLRLLAGHPQALVYRPTQYEPRAVTFWMDVLRAVSEPASYLRQVTPDRIDFTQRGWWLGAQTPLPRGIADPEVEQWMGSESILATAAICQGRIEAFYERIADHLGRPNASYFVEKCAVRSTVPSMIWELYPRAREVILVRDFRDMVCSMLALNEKVSFQGFGRRRAASDAEFIQEQMGKLATAFVKIWQGRSDRAHLVRYEDLVLHREQTLARLLAYLELDAGAASVRSMQESLDERVPEMEGHGTSAGPEASIGRWKHDLSVELQETCEVAFGPALEVFGYPADGYAKT